MAVSLLGLSLVFSAFVGTLMSGLFLFVLLSSHVASMLIHLEILSLYLVSLVLVVTSNMALKTLFVFFLVCIIVSEAALGLSFLVVSSRHSMGELEKFN